MSAPESETFRDLRARHKARRKALHEMNRLLRATHQREAVMRGEFEHLPEPGLRAYAEIIRRRSDLTMSQALPLVAELFTDE